MNYEIIAIDYDAEADELDLLINSSTPSRRIHLLMRESTPASISKQDRSLAQPSMDMPSLRTRSRRMSPSVWIR